jgi:hypothetical protein
MHQDSHGSQRLCVYKTPGKANIMRRTYQYNKGAHTVGFDLRQLILPNTGSNLRLTRSPHGNERTAEFIDHYLGNSWHTMIHVRDRYDLLLYEFRFKNFVHSPWYFAGSWNSYADTVLFHQEN